MGFNEKLWADTKRNTEDIEQINTLTNGNIGLENMTEAAINALSGTGTIPPVSSVTPRKTNFSTFSRNLCNEDKLQIGRLNGSTGVFDVAQTTYKTTDYMPVTVGNYIIPCYSISNVIGYNNVCFYNESLVFISGTFTGTTAVLIPTNAKYARVSWSDGYLVTGYLYVEDKATNTSSGYVPFYEKINSVLNRITGYESKKLVTYGDSITAQGEWQQVVIDYFCFSTHGNYGLGGALVTGASDSTTAMFSDSRINAIPTNTEVVIFMGGVNDSAVSTPIGNLGNLITTEFKGAYSLVIEKLQTRCPNAKIICMTPTFHSNYSQVDAYGMPSNSLGFNVKDYGTAVIDVCRYYGVECIDVHGKSGINKLNFKTYLKDDIGDTDKRVHPNALGGQLISNVVINNLPNLR